MLVQTVADTFGLAQQRDGVSWVDASQQYVDKAHCRAGQYLRRYSNSMDLHMMNSFVVREIECLSAREGSDFAIHTPNLWIWEYERLRGVVACRTTPIKIC